MFSVVKVHNSPGLVNLTLTQTLFEEMHVVTFVCMLRSSARSVAWKLFEAPLQTLIGLRTQIGSAAQHSTIPSGGSECLDKGEFFFKSENDEVKLVREQWSVLVKASEHLLLVETLFFSCCLSNCAQPQRKLHRGNVTRSLGFHTAAEQDCNKPFTCYMLSYISSHKNGIFNANHDVMFVRTVLWQLVAWEQDTQFECKYLK